MLRKFSSKDFNGKEKKMKKKSITYSVSKGKRNALEWIELRMYYASRDLVTVAEGEEPGICETVAFCSHIKLQTLLSSQFSHKSLQISITLA